jgi:hypothetical protein
MTATRIPRRRAAYIPAGCDQQGRLPHTSSFIQAAEAANDIGTEDLPDFTAKVNRALAFWIVATTAAIGAAFLVVWVRP